MADLYNLASHYWGGDSISLRASTQTGDIFATIPVEFLRGSGMNTWFYVSVLANMLVNPEPNCSGVIQMTGGDALDYSSEPCAGEYVYTYPGKCRFSSISVFSLEHRLKNRFELS